MKTYKICRKCGTKYEKDSMLCPGCGVKNKKPLIKRPWFILLLFVVIIALITGIMYCRAPKLSDNFGLGKMVKLKKMKFRAPKGWKKKKRASSKTKVTYVKYSGGRKLGTFVIRYKGRIKDCSQKKAEEILKKLYKKNKKVIIKSVKSHKWGKTNADYTAKCIYKSRGRTRVSDIEYVIADNTLFIFSTDSRRAAMRHSVLKKLVQASNVKNYRNPAKLKKITASYKGPTKTGTKIDKKSKIVVNAHYSDGFKREVTGWKLDGSDTLKTGKISHFTVKYKGKKTPLKIICTSLTQNQKAAYAAALSYLPSMPYSRKGLLKQLTSNTGDNFSDTDAEIAVSLMEQRGEVDWNKQAVKAAKEYKTTMTFSRDEMLDWMQSEYGAGFTYKQAVYGINKVYK